MDENTILKYSSQIVSITLRSMVSRPIYKFYDIIISEIRVLIHEKVFIE